MTKYDYTMPTGLADDYAGNLAIFLLSNKGSIFALWCGHMRAADQRRLFGRYLGKGRVYIDGKTEELEHHVSVCFGTDYGITEGYTWSQL